MIFIEYIYLSINKLLTNPTGKNTAYMASRQRIRDNLDLKFEKLLHEHKKFTYKIYKVNKGYLFIFKIPSETYDKLYYDVAIQVENEENIHTTSIVNYKLYVFSNSPDFIFTYAYVANKNNFLVPDMKIKVSKKALTEKTAVRNPVEQYGFEKSCYYACKYLKYNNLLEIKNIEKNMYLYNKEKVLANIKTDMEKKLEYDTYKNRKAKQKKVDKTIRMATKNLDFLNILEKLEKKNKKENTTKSKYLKAKPKLKKQSKKPKKKKL